jgi:hypothetical protein
MVAVDAFFHLAREAAVTASRTNHTLNKSACISVVVKTYDLSGYADTTAAEIG